MYSQSAANIEPAIIADHYDNIKIRYRESLEKFLPFFHNLVNLIAKGPLMTNLPEETTETLYNLLLWIALPISNDEILDKIKTRSIGLLDGSSYDMFKTELGLGDIATYVLPKMIDLGLWGPIYWEFLHWNSVALLPFTSTNLDNFYAIQLDNFNILIPCAACLEHYDTNLKEHRYCQRVSSGGLNYAQAIFQLHNNVNQQTKKALFTWNNFINYYILDKRR